MPNVMCEVCGNDKARLRRLTRSYGKGRHLLVIENIPVIDCPNCGESYMTAETMHEIERIKLHRKDFAAERAVAVAEYA